MSNEPIASTPSADPTQRAADSDSKAAEVADNRGSNEAQRFLVLEENDITEYLRAALRNQMPGAVVIDSLRTPVAAAAAAVLAEADAKANEDAWAVQEAVAREAILASARDIARLDLENAPEGHTTAYGTSERAAQVEAALGRFGSLGEEDQAQARAFAAEICSLASRKCPFCKGCGVVKRSLIPAKMANGQAPPLARSSWETCHCVRAAARHKRLQMLDRAAHTIVPALHAAVNEAKGASRRVEEAKLVEARVSLARAQEAQRAACAERDAEIEGVTLELALRERVYAAASVLIGQRNAALAGALRLQADLRDHELLAERSATPHGVLAFVFDAAFAGFAIAVVGLRSDLELAARTEHTIRRILDEHKDQGLADNLDDLRVEIEVGTASLGELRATRARIAGHHQPKIDKAQNRLRRLEYLAGMIAPR